VKLLTTEKIECEKCGKKDYMFLKEASSSFFEASRMPHSPGGLILTCRKCGNKEFCAKLREF